MTLFKISPVPHAEIDYSLWSYLFSLNFLFLISSLKNVFLIIKKLHLFLKEKKKKHSTNKMKMRERKCPQFYLGIQTINTLVFPSIILFRCVALSIYTEFNLSIFYNNGVVPYVHLCHWWLMCFQGHLFPFLSKIFSVSLFARVLAHMLCGNRNSMVIALRQCRDPAELWVHCTCGL